MSSADILILGKGGQVSNAMAALLQNRALVVGAEEVNFLDSDFTKKLDAHRGGRDFSAVINAAAYTHVDESEGEGRAAAQRINATAAGELAAWCKARRLPLVHYSSDYVFDGGGDTPWRESDTPSPVNAYGKTKLDGEKLIEAQGGDYLILRTSWLYDATGKNFFNTMRRLFAEKTFLNVVSDQIGAPTYVPHLAQATLAALERAMAGDRFAGGVYHLCSGGQTSWCGFAGAILAYEKDALCREVRPIPSSAYPLPAPRPLNSRLDCMKIKEAFGVAMPAWEDGLAACMSSI